MVPATINHTFGADVVSALDGEIRLLKNRARGCGMLSDLRHSVTTAAVSRLDSAIAGPGKMG